MQMVACWPLCRHTEHEIAKPRTSADIASLHSTVTCQQALGTPAQAFEVVAPIRTASGMGNLVSLVAGPCPRSLPFETTLGPGTQPNL